VTEVRTLAVPRTAAVATAGATVALALLVATMGSDGDSGGTASAAANASGGDSGGTASAAANASGGASAQAQKNSGSGKKTTAGGTRIIGDGSPLDTLVP
jgi:hypothetical protein